HRPHAKTHLRAKEPDRVAVGIEQLRLDRRQCVALFEVERRTHATITALVRLALATAKVRLLPINRRRSCGTRTRYRGTGAGTPVVVRDAILIMCYASSTSISSVRPLACHTP